MAGGRRGNENQTRPMGRAISLSEVEFTRVVEPFPQWRAKKGENRCGRPRIGTASDGRHFVGALTRRRLSVRLRSEFLAGAPRDPSGVDCSGFAAAPDRSQAKLSCHQDSSC